MSGSILYAQPGNSANDVVTAAKDVLNRTTGKSDASIFVFHFTNLINDKNSITLKTCYFYGKRPNIQTDETYTFYRYFNPSSRAGTFPVTGCLASLICHTGCAVGYG